MNLDNDKLAPRGHMGKTILFESKKDQEDFYKDFHSKSTMIAKFSSWNYQGNYNTSNVNFEKLIVEEIIEKNLIKEKDFQKYDYKLEKMHLCLNSSKKELDESEQNKVSVSFYETSSKLKEIYADFIEKVISPLFDEEIYFQVVPTFRFHFPNQKGYEWSDRYHTDVMLGHPPYEFNIWVPFTGTYESNSMRLTSYDDSMSILNDNNFNFEIFSKNVQYDEILKKKLKDKSESLKMNYGEFIIFDPRCLHCTQHNITEDTRISMDTRIILKSKLKKYSREYRTTGRKKMPFTPGHYFSKKSI